MPYVTIEELPYNVRQALGDDLSQSWMNHYNNAMQSYGECQLARLHAWRNIRQETDQVRWFESYATCQIKDAHGEILDVEAIARCMPTYIDGGGELAVSHRAGTYGTVYDYEVKDHPRYGKPSIYIYGAIFRGRPSWDKLWGILSSKRQGETIPLAVSIGGSMRAGVQWVCDQSGECEDRVIADDLREISITYSPANPAAVGHANALAKNMEDNTMTEVEKMNKEESPEESSDNLAELVKALSDKVSVIEAGYNDLQKAVGDLATAIEGVLKASNPGEEEEEKEEPEESEDKTKAIEDRIKHLEAFAEDYRKAQEQEADTPAPPMKMPMHESVRYDGSIAAKMLYARR